MAYLQQALADFGQDIGLDLQPLQRAGELQLRLEDGSLLGIVHGEDEVVVHCAWPLSYNVAETMQAVMKQVALTRGANEALQVGLRTTPSDNWLVLGTRFPEDQVSAGRIREAHDFLRRWLSALELRI